MSSSHSLQNGHRLSNLTPDSHRLRAVFILDEEAADLIYGPEERLAIERLVDLEPQILTRATWEAHEELLAEADIIFSGWGAPLMDEHFLSRAPNLKVVFYGAGSVRRCTTDAFWERGVRITSAYAANAFPVAEYTVATAILGLKQFWRHAEAAKHGEPWGDHTRPMTGAYRSTIGLVSFGMIARKVAELLQCHDTRQIAYCPITSQETAESYNVMLTSLDNVFTMSDVVSIHTPVLEETIGLVTGKHIESMRPNATLINTSRGPILNQPEVLAALRQRTDVTAILDVTTPEPPEPGSAVLSMPNVIVTPHIAGSHGHECRRMGYYMLQELRSYLADKPLHWELNHQQTLAMA